jgi:hypothetical protein
MNVKTIKGALLKAERTIKKTYKEKIISKYIVNENDALVETEFSVYLIHYTAHIDRDFGKLFPNVAKQILWNEGIRIKKKTILEFANRKNEFGKKLAIIFVLSNGAVFQISPVSIISFCEALNLEIEKDGVYYFFPTILLSRLSGAPTKKETIAKSKLSLIAQINNIENQEEITDETPMFSLSDFDTDVISEIIQLLRSINERLKNIEKKLDRRN